MLLPIVDEGGLDAELGFKVGVHPSVVFQFFGEVPQMLESLGVEF